MLSKMKEIIRYLDEDMDYEALTNLLECSQTE
jgi:hypothetical protein